MSSTNHHNKLVVSEQFYSIQGEGPSVGYPAVFLRLAACNLQCPGFSYRDPNTQQHLGCDSKAVWQQGKRWQIADIFNHWQQQGWWQAFQQGAHLVLTGGEPLLQQPGLTALLTALDDELDLLQPVYVEIETNATCLPSPDLLQRLNQINASPKLAHSGESKDKRYHPQVITTLLAHVNGYFKFVISQPSDVEEVLRDFIGPFAIPPQRVLLMAEGGTRAIIAERAEFIVPLCKQYGFRYSPRLHIDLYGEVTGV